MITSPSNEEFFAFLVEQLAFSVFRRSGLSLMSFKEAIEFVLLPVGTDEGPEEGILFEGCAALNYGAWAEFAASFVMTSVENLPDLGDGSPLRVYYVDERAAAIPPLATLTQCPPPSGAAGVREELRSDRSHYTWTGAGRAAADPGWVSLRVRRVACRGVDKGMPARLVFLDKLREYRCRRTSGREVARSTACHSLGAFVSR